jgi:hypothetical protein
LGALSKELKDFIAEHVHSVIRLEVLLLIAEKRHKAWGSAAVERKLHLSPNSTKAHLDELLSQGLLTTIDGAEETLYRYHPSSDELHKTVAQLSNAYATQRVAVLTLIFANPVDKLRLFTEAFRMIKAEDERKHRD